MRERAARAHPRRQVSQVAPHQGGAPHATPGTRESLPAPSSTIGGGWCTDHQAACAVVRVVRVVRVAWEQVLVSCSYDDTIKLWADDQDDWYCLDTLTGHTSTVWEVALSNDGERMGTATPPTTTIAAAAATQYSLPPIFVAYLLPPSSPPPSPPVFRVWLLILISRRGWGFGGGDACICIYIYI